MTDRDDGALPATHPTLAESEAHAARWHAGQRDKAGAPYLGHLERVQGHLLRLFPGASAAERHAAWLHDVLEDTAVGEEDLRALGYAPAVLRIVRAVTKSGAPMPYAARIEALVQSGDRSAMRVKMADLSDNADPARLAALPAETAARLSAQYGAALARLRQALEG